MHYKYDKTWQTKALMTELHTDERIGIYKD